MRIALITDGITPYIIGGIQRHSFNLTRHLARLGVEIDLYQTDYGHAKPINELEGMTAKEKSQITSISVPWPKRGYAPGHYLQGLVAYSKEAYRRFSETRPPDFVYAQGLTGLAFTAARADKQLSIPVAVNLHGLEMFQPALSLQAIIYNALFRRLARRQMHQADCVFSFGGKIRELVNREKVPPERILEIPNAIPGSWVLEKPKADLKGVCRFVFIGRAERRKGIEELTSALVTLNHGRLFRFDFVGPIPSAKQLKRPEIKYHGSITGNGKLQDILDSSDVLVCPSHAEGMPTVILEAMARGLAIIATDVGAVRLMVGVDNGILLPQCSVQLIQQAMERLIVLPAAGLIALKEASLRKVRQFTWDRVAQTTLDHIAARAN